MSTAGEKRIPRDVSSALRAFLFATDLYRNGRRACSWLRRTLQWLSDCYRVSGGKEEASRRATRSFSLIYLSCWKLQRRHYPSASYRYRFKVHAAFSHRAPNAFENSVEEKLLYLDIHIYWTKFLFFLFFFFFTSENCLSIVVRRRNRQGIMRRIRRMSRGRFIRWESSDGSWRILAEEKIPGHPVDSSTVP